MKCCMSKEPARFVFCDDVSPWSLGKVQKEKPSSYSASSTICAVSSTSMCSKRSPWWTTTRQVCGSRRVAILSRAIGLRLNGKAAIISLSSLD